MASVWRYVDELAGRDLPISVIFEFFGYYTVTTLYMAIPLAILLASIMTLGNLGERYELIAMKAAGISLFRILRPLVLIVVALSFLTFYVSNNVAPIALFKAKALMSDIVNKNPEFLLKEGTFSSEMPGVTLKVERLSKEEDGRFYDAIIYQKSNSGRIKKTITAQSGKMKASQDLKFMTIWLYNGKIYEAEETKRGKPFTRTSFDEYMVIAPMKSSELKRKDKKRSNTDYRMMPYKQLDTLINNNKETRRIAEETAKRVLTQQRYFSKMSRDSAILQKQWKPINVDSVLNGLSYEEKSVVLSTALAQAKSTEEYLLGKEEYYSKLQTFTAKSEEYWHQKFNWPFSCLIFFFVGAALGAIVRKGGLGMPVLISILIFIAFYMINKYGANLFVAKGYLPAYIGNWIGTFLFMVLGIWLMYKAATDSGLMDAEIYKRTLDKLFKNKFIQKVKSIVPFLR